MKKDVEEIRKRLCGFYPDLEREKIERIAIQYDINEVDKKILLYYINLIEKLQKEHEELKRKLEATTLLVKDKTIKMYEETEMELETRITELEEKNKELKMLMAHKNGYTQQLEQDLYENGSNCVIPKQKIKDKIEEVKNEEDLYARGNIIAILQELLEEEK